MEEFGNTSRPEQHRHFHDDVIVDQPCASKQIITQTNSCQCIWLPDRDVHLPDVWYLHVYVTISSPANRGYRQHARPANGRFSTAAQWRRHPRDNANDSCGGLSADGGIGGEKVGRSGWSAEWRYTHYTSSNLGIQWDTFTSEYKYSLLMRGVKIESPAKFSFEWLTFIHEWVHLFSIYELSLLWLVCETK